MSCGPTSSLSDDISSPLPETPENPQKSTLWTPGYWKSYEADSDSEDDQSATVKVFNDAMKQMSKCTRENKVDPLTDQLTGAWSDVTNNERESAIKKATEACKVVCEVIAPNAANDLFEAVKSGSELVVSEDLKTLMLAYQNATTRNLKLQILSLYAHRYTILTLKKIHQPYGSISTWQIKRARLHARNNGPGNLPEKTKQHRIRLDMSKVDHFIEFANRPYFYQDVAFGTRKLKLDSGSTLTMPNVIRNVTRSTIISQYSAFCMEENYEPLSNRTLFRILEVREASEKKSLQGIDNIAADGSLGFERLKNIVLELESLGVEKQWVENILKRLHDDRLYLKTDYAVHCGDASPCPDHCRMFALSDSNDKLFQEICSHDHSLFCDRCERMKETMKEIQMKLLHHSSTMYSKDQKEDFLYDFRRRREDIFRWKCHILRSCNQELAKQAVMQNLDENSALVIMDWAMKFLQLRHREKQSDWYGKRGISWHVSSVVTKDSMSSKTVSVSTYAHLLDSCSQDWYAVLSVFEDLLLNIRQNLPSVKTVFLRSDEAGCYHNNLLIASLKALGKRAGIEVERYDYSEPQFGKDICDRILCPMKLSLRNYCNEGNDILNAHDMRNALYQRPVRGTTVAVNQVNESVISHEINNIEHISSLHNFKFEEKGIRVWKAYGIGEGKLIPYKDVIVKAQGSTRLKVVESFYPFTCRSSNCEKSEEGNEDSLFECTVPGCEKVFKKYEELNLHIQTGGHNRLVQNVTLYDRIRSDWAARFATIDVRFQAKEHKNKGSTQKGVLVTESVDPSSAENNMGWALSKPKTGAVRFSKNVRDYLTAKFDAGERSGRKANPMDVEKEMRNARDVNNCKRFTREEWLTSTQIKGFFSRLAARRKRSNSQMQEDIYVEEIEEEEIEDVEAEREEFTRQEIMNAISDTLNVEHPVIYDVYDLCELYKEKRLHVFNVSMLKEICKHFEISFKSKDRKQVLIEKIEQMLADCSCN